ncbi:DNA-binding MarR family transcriptional regulator [Fictibacillus halophilus]|uniref:DNA-binding MarR family transcriptional regulator n=1 Tax=Fictibacillus halophilus TaxID=1610490 RepID=A0ABV2LLZ9_9BACL|nr:MarR family transcriptional regulator [Fictibacillus halophilus]
MEDVRDLLQNLSRKYETLQKNSCRLVEEDLTLAHSHILYEISKHSKPSMQHIADNVGVDITTFSRQVKSLIRTGLVEKRVNPNDKRISFLLLTEKGVHTISHLNTILSTRLNQNIKGLSEFERNTIIQALKILTKSLSTTK